MRRNRLPLAATLALVAASIAPFGAGCSSSDASPSAATTTHDADVDSSRTAASDDATAPSEDDAGDETGDADGASADGEATSDAEMTEGGTLPADGGRCDPTTRWPQMAAASLTPRTFGGVDLASSSYDQAILINCIANFFGAGTKNPDDQAVAWGDHAEVQLEYDPQGGAIDYVQLNPGYTGALTFHSRSGGAYGAHTYSIALGAPISRDGAAFTIDWTAPAAPITELYDGYLATFFASHAPASADCTNDGSCLSASTGNGSTGMDAAFGFGLARPDDFYVGIHDQTSMPNVIYAFVNPNRS